MNMLAAQIKERLTAREVVEFYGFYPNRAGYIQCPFHAGDNHGSLKVYTGDKTGWHCFGCGAGGSVIDFVMKLFDISFPQACVRLSSDFGFDLTSEERTSQAELQALAKSRKREAEPEPTSFGRLLRQIRKEFSESQDKFAARIGTSKQVLSRYEVGQRTTKISLAEKYVRSLGVTVDYLMGGSPQEEAFDSVCRQTGKPFYQIFLDVEEEMRLLIPDIVRITGLTDWQVRTIILRRMKEAPLPITLQLSRTLEVPLEVWTGNEAYKAGNISFRAKEAAMTHDKATPTERAMVRMVLDLPPVAEDEPE